MPFADNFTQGKNHHLRIDAQRKMTSALACGSLVRADKCEDCDRPAEHGHHDDYAYPLDVSWLCRKCHRKRHYGYSKDTVATTLFVPRSLLVRLKYLATERGVSQQSIWIMALSEHLNRVEVAQHA